MYGIFYNPISGRGLAQKYANELADYFTLRGEKVVVRESSLEGVDPILSEALSGLIIVGGDGTIRPYLSQLSNLGIPVILFPAGNESLIAKQFLVNRSIPALYDRVKRNQPSSHYYGLVNNQPFFLMCSVGFDADVVHWVSANRKLYSSNMLYVKGIMASIFNRATKYELSVGGKLDSIEGTIIVANSSFYGGGVRPVADADSRERVFKVRCFRGTYLKMVLNFVLMRLGLDRSKHNISAPLVKIRLLNQGLIKYQIDGDALSAQTELEITKSDKPILYY